MNILDNYFRKFHVLFILKFKFSYGLVIFLLLSAFSGVSQTFDRLNTQNLKGGHIGFSSFVDYNNDGFLDVFVTGVDFDNRFNNAVFYKNNGDLSFTESNITNIPRVIYGDHSWGDFDNNGTQDLLYTGTTSGGADYAITKVYKNSKNGCEFIEIPLGLPGIYTGSSKWVDIDSDGLLDIYLSGFDVSGVAIITAYKNEGDDTFTKQDISTLDGVLGGRGNFTRNKSRWEDFDNDGLQDLIIAVSSKTDKSFDVYKNLGNFQFSKQNIGLPQLSYVAMDIDDINNDGLADIVFTGSPNLENTSGDGTGDFYIFTNNGNMNFSNTFTIADEGVFYNDIELGDMDNDGFLDAINYGTGPWGTFPEITKMYKNNGNGTFSNFSHTLPDCRFGGVEFGDFDNDNDLDILYFGRISDPRDNEITYIYENKLIDKAAPSDIVVSQNCICDNTLNFSLNSDSDSVIWSFDDPTTGALNTSLDKKTSHLFSNEMTYTISATYTKGTLTSTITKVVNIIGLPSIAKPDDLVTCSGGSVNTFDFNTLKDTEILQGASLDNFELFYYTSYNNAESDVYRLTMPYNSQNVNETIYTRVQNKNNSNCFVITDFDIIYEAPPIANTVVPLFTCDDNDDGFALFDLTSTVATVIGTQDKVTVEYYDNLGTIIPVSSLSIYENTIANSETITARIVSTETGCFAETEINLVVNPQPKANIISELTGCDDDNDGISKYFDTSMVKAEVLGNQTNIDVTFYNSNGDLLSVLQNPYTNIIPDSDFITARLTDRDTGCFTETRVLFRTVSKISCIEESGEEVVIDGPKFFSPNNDGFHDYWQIKNINKYPNSRIFIFDRYGKLLKEFTENSVGWDGFYNKKALMSDDYWYRVKLSNGQIFSGHFSLIR